MTAGERKSCKIYIIDSLGAQLGWKCVNYDRLQRDTYGFTAKVAWPDGPFSVTRGPWTLPEFVESPHIVFERKLGPAAWDAQYKDGCLFISAKFKSLIEEIAPNTCEFRPCVTEYRNGEPGPEVWLCSPIKAFAQSIDVEKSNVSLSRFGDYLFSSSMKLAFIEPEMSGAHLFRIAEMGNSIFCDEYFKLRCKANSMKSISFKEIGRLYI